jgi:hypothetical protein
MDYLVDHDLFLEAERWSARHRRPVIKAPLTGPMTSASRTWSVINQVMAAATKQNNAKKPRRP